MKRKQQPYIPNIFELGFHIFDKWMKLKNDGKSLQLYFDDNEIQTIAIYGMGALGSRLYDDILELPVEVKYIIDKNASQIRETKKELCNIEIYTCEQELPIVDAIVITPIQFYNEIERDLGNKCDADIISIEDVVDYCFYRG